MNTLRKNVAEKLKKLDPKSLNMVLGLDGFVDEIVHLVDKRYDQDNFKRIETITQLAQRIEKAAGLSSNIELMPIVKKLGGNGPIMCNALAMHDSKITYIGALGQPQIEDVFLEMADKVKIYSLAQPGHTDALEFFDGKLMLGKMKYLNDITYEKMVDVIGFDELVKLFNQADLIATVNWSMLPHMTDIWNKLASHVLPKMTLKTNKPYFFIDLADPEKRDPKDITHALETLKQFTSHFNVVLGLNKKEAFDVSRVLKTYTSDVMPTDLKELALPLYHYLGYYAVVIHPVDCSCIVVDGKYEEHEGPFVKEPKLTTGAGDNFNSGTMLGLMLGLEPGEAITLGMATSGFYVRNACSPSTKELISFIEQWSIDKV